MNIETNVACLFKRCPECHNIHEWELAF